MYSPGGLRGDIWWLLDKKYIYKSEELKMHPAGYPVSQAPWSEKNIEQEQSLVQI